MAKITLSNVASGFNIQTINNNFATIAAALNDDVYWRDNPAGEANALLQDMDVNGKRLYNLAAPQNPTDAARFGDIPTAPVAIGTGAAINITFTPTANIAAINTQAAIEETDSENRAISLAVRTDLADTADVAKGDALVFVKKTMADAVALSLHAWFEAAPIYITDCMSAAEKADYFSGAMSLDLTSAINKVLQSTIAFASVIKRTVYAQRGTAKITSSLYLRAGCGLVGAGGTATKIVASGMAGTDLMLRMGYGNIAGVPTSDGSGLVPHVDGVFFNGTGTAISTLGQAGFRINKCWFSCTAGIDAAGADGIISECVVDVLTPVGITVRGARLQILGCHFNNPNYGIQFNTPMFTRISEIVISDCLFFACAYASSYAYADAVIGDVTFSNCKFTTSTTAGVRQTDQRHFFTQAGSTFERIRFVGCEFDNVKQNDIQIASGTGTIEAIGCHFRNTGVVDGGSSVALQHSIVATTAITLIARNNTFSAVGGQSIRLTHGSAHSRISDNHNFGCGTGGTGLAAEANEGDRAHFSFHNGSTDHVVSNNTTDSAVLYVAGTFNFTFFQGRLNKSLATYDTHSSTAGGTYIDERHNGVVTQTVASATGAQTLPTGMPNFLVTGSNVITSIVAAGWAGKTVILISSAGTWTLTDGSNLKLAGNLVATGDDTITLFCDGTNWYELMRSVN